jgi:4-amino-4-deoxy-L-arabinose transferase-like glycosyltransferase
MTAPGSIGSPFASADGARLFTIAVSALLALRLGLLLLLWTVGGEPIQPDSPLYLQLAAALVERGWFSSSAEVFQPEVFRTPGYPAYLALFQWLGPTGIVWPLLVQELLYLSAVGVFYVGTRALLDVGLARAVVIFLLLEPGGIAYPKLIASDTLNVALIVPAIFALGWHLKTGRWSWLIAAGVLLGAAAWVRPAAFLLPVVFAPVLIVAGRFRRVAFVRAGLLVLVATLTLSPWLARNQAVFGTPYLSGQASNMFANYHLPYVWEVTRELPFQQGQREAAALAEQAIATAERERGRPLNAVERLDVQQQMALHVLREYPGVYAQRWLIGMLKTLLGPGLLDAYIAYDHQPDRVRFSAIDEPSFGRKLGLFLAGQDWLVLAEVLMRGVLLTLAVIGVVVIVRSGSPFLWIILLFSAYTVAIPGPMGLTRLRFAAEGFLFLQAWIGLRCATRLLRGHEGQRQNNLTNRRVDERSEIHRRVWWTALRSSTLRPRRFRRLGTIDEPLDAARDRSCPACAL